MVFFFCLEAQIIKKKKKTGFNKESFQYKHLMVASDGLQVYIVKIGNIIVKPLVVFLFKV